MVRKAKHKQRLDLKKLVLLMTFITGTLKCVDQIGDTVPKVVNWVSVAIYGPPLTYVELESMRVPLPTWASQEKK